jgi:fructose-specific phosphotransferase system IIC component
MKPLIVFGQIGFGIMFSVFSGAVAYSIAGKAAAAPGFVAGSMITNSNLLFVGFG